VPIALISLQFDPFLHLGDRLVRWEPVALAGAILLALIVAALIAGRSPIPPFADDPPGSVRHLRRDDLLLIVLGIVPGAVVGGRLAYVALHLDYFDANRWAILNASAGSLALSGAVVFGAATGALVARLFDAPIGRWFHVAAVPTLLVLGLGKAALILGGTGQGLPSTLDWATRYLGPGPWGSLGPEVPSHPAQAYEALGVGIVLVVVLLIRAIGLLRKADGRAFAFALAGWATVRLVVAGTWRDPVALGPFNVEQVIDLGIVGFSALAYTVIVWRSAIVWVRAVPVAEAETGGPDAIKAGSEQPDPDPDPSPPALTET
jgi:prolipoprotein diacylglyceryltransferase